MSLDLAESLIAKGRLDPDDVAARFADSYRWSRGYGPGTAKLLRRIRRGMAWRDAARSVYPDGSFGNGGAMRAPVIGLFHASRIDGLIEAARVSAQITHAHPLGIEGAVLVACAVSCVLRSADAEQVLELAARHCQQTPFRERLDIARRWLGTGRATQPEDVVKQLGRGIAAAESCVTAVYLGLRFIPRPFSELHRFVAACGGDADTIGAMSGALWGAANGAGALPQKSLQKLEQRQRLEKVAAALYRG